MENPNVDEKERAMGFCTCTTTVKAFLKELAGKFWGNCLTWIFNLVLVK
jgi:hypothetical protein